MVNPRRREENTKLINLCKSLSLSILNIPEPMAPHQRRNRENSQIIFRR
jgi:hypothetical protein